MKKTDQRAIDILRKQSMKRNSSEWPTADACAGRVVRMVSVVQHPRRTVVE